MRSSSQKKSKTLNWAYYPKSQEATELAVAVVRVFEAAYSKISSDKHNLVSNDVLASVKPRLLKIGFAVESGKKQSEKITVPVLFGLNGRIDKSFDADAHHKAGHFVLEVEAGRAVANNQFLKDLFQACMMHDVKYVGIAVRNKYKDSRDFEYMARFFDTLYASNRLQLPLDGILLIGY